MDQLAHYLPGISNTESNINNNEGISTRATLGDNILGNAFLKPLAKVAKNAYSSIENMFNEEAPKKKGYQLEIEAYKKFPTDPAKRKQYQKQLTDKNENLQNTNTRSLESSVGPFAIKYLPEYSAKKLNISKGDMYGILNSNSEELETGAKAALDVLARNYSKLQKKNPKLSKEELIDLSISSYNNGSKQNDPDYIRYYIKKDSKKLKDNYLEKVKGFNSFEDGGKKEIEPKISPEARSMGDAGIRFGNKFSTSLGANLRDKNIRAGASYNKGNFSTDINYTRGLDNTSNFSGNASYNPGKYNLNLSYEKGPEGYNNLSAGAGYNGDNLSGNVGYNQNNQDRSLSGDVRYERGNFSGSLGTNFTLGQNFNPNVRGDIGYQNRNLRTSIGAGYNKETGFEPNIRATYTFQDGGLKAKADRAYAQEIYDQIRPSDYTSLNNYARYIFSVKRDDYDDARSEEAFKQYLGLNDKPKYLSPSKYAPSIKAKGKEGEYYKVDPELENDIFHSYKDKVKLNEVVPVDEINIKSEWPVGTPLTQDGYVKLDPYDDNIIVGRPMASRARMLGRFTVSRGKDKKGEYLSYSDQYDFPDTFQNKMKGKPYNVYNRIYYKDMKQMGGTIENNEKSFLQEYQEGGKKVKGVKPYNFNNGKYKIEKSIMSNLGVNDFRDSVEEAAEKQGISGLHNGGLDAIRHASSAAKVSSQMPLGLGVLSANVLGLIHEISPESNWRETKSDLYNNFAGSLVGGIPFISDKTRSNILIEAQKRGYLSDLGEKDEPLNTKRPTLKKKSEGGTITDNEKAFLQEFRQGGTIPVSSNGVYDYPGQEVIVPTNSGRITMKNVPYDILGIDEYGNQQMMQSNGEYQFPGKIIHEIPQTKKKISIKSKLK